jgi:hypothetical protein
MTTVKRQGRRASSDTDHSPNYFIPTLQKAVRNITDRPYIGDVMTWSQLQSGSLLKGMEVTSRKVIPGPRSVICTSGWCLIRPRSNNKKDKKRYRVRVQPNSGRITFFWSRWNFISQRMMMMGYSCRVTEVWLMDPLGQFRNNFQVQLTVWCTNMLYYICRILQLKYKHNWCYVE